MSGFCDIYSLGFGPISVSFKTGTFAIRNLQALYGYRMARIPAAVLNVACGPLGNWTPAMGGHPLLEIVPHHDHPETYPKLPAEMRTPALRARGLGRPVVHVTDEILELLFPTILKELGPRTVADAPLARRIDVPKSPIRELVKQSLPESATGEETILDDGDGPPDVEDVGPRVDDENESAVPEMLDQLTTTRPPLIDDEIDSEEKESCAETTAAGRRCERKATVGEYCRWHAKKHAEAK